MNKTEIKSILDRYFEGTSTLAEEKALKEYFSTDAVDTEFEEYRSLFVFFSEEQKETSNRIFTLETKAKSIKRFSHTWKLGIAASVMLLIGSWLFSIQDTDSMQVSQSIDWSKYEPKSDEQAAQLMLSAFKRTSKAMKKGTQVAAHEVLQVGEIMGSIVSQK